MALRKAAEPCEMDAMGFLFDARVWRIAREIVSEGRSNIAVARRFNQQASKRVDRC